MSKVVPLPLVLMPHCKSAILLASCQDAERRNFFDSLVTFGEGLFPIPGEENYDFCFNYLISQNKELCHKSKHE